MREIFSDEFDDIKQKKVHEKVLYQRIAFTVVCILAYLSAMGFTAYAFFTADVTSSSNTITAATYVMDCTITPDESEAFDDYSISYDGKEGLPKEYEIRISIGDDNTAMTGFCVVEVLKAGDTDSIVYHTAQIWNEESVEEGKSQSLSFTLILNEGATVTFTPHWGTSSHYAEYQNHGDNGEWYIEAGETLAVGVLKTSQTESGEELNVQEPEAKEGTKTQEETKAQQTVTEEETEEQQAETEEPIVEDIPQEPAVEETIEQPTEGEPVTEDPTESQ